MLAACQGVVLSARATEMRLTIRKQEWHVLFGDVAGTELLADTNCYFSFPSSSVSVQFLTSLSMLVSLSITIAHRDTEKRNHFFYMLLF